MLLNRHDLYAVVAEFGYARQNILTELVVCAYTLLLGSHADVALIDEQRSVGFPTFRTAALAHIELFLRSPNLCREDFCIVVLHYAACIRRNALSVASEPLNEQLIVLTVANLLFGEITFPHPIANRIEAVVLTLVPVVEVAFYIDGCCVRCPLAEYPSGVKVV